MYYYLYQKLNLFRCHKLDHSFPVNIEIVFLSNTRVPLGHSKPHLIIFPFAEGSKMTTRDIQISLLITQNCQLCHRLCHIWIQGGPLGGSVWHLRKFYRQAYQHPGCVLVTRDLVKLSITVTDRLNICRSESVNDGDIWLNKYTDKTYMTRLCALTAKTWSSCISVIKSIFPHHWQNIQWNCYQFLLLKRRQNKRFGEWCWLRWLRCVMGNGHGLVGVFLHLATCITV